MGPRLWGDGSFEYSCVKLNKCKSVQVVVTILPTIVVKSFGRKWPFLCSLTWRAVSFIAQITKAAQVIVEAPHLGVKEIMGTEGPDVGGPRGGPTLNFLGVTRPTHQVKMAEHLRHSSLVPAETHTAYAPEVLLERA